MTDSDYEKRRNKLIPSAAALANEMHGSYSTIDRESWVVRWNTTFLKEMDRTAREAGLIT